MKSFLNNIHEIIGDFYPEEYYSIYARPSSGKSLYFLSEAANLISQGATVVYLNTESGFQGIFDYWKPKLEVRFNIKFTEQNFKLFKLYSLESLMEFLGNPIMITVKDKGKLGTFLMEAKKSSEVDSIYKHISHSKNLVFFLDSFSALMREGFNSVVENFSARADATGFLFATLKELMHNTGGFVFMSHHASIDPMNFYHQKDKMRGGTVVAYYSKYVLFFETQLKNTMRDYRKCWGVRVSGQKDWEKSTWLRIDSEGFQDATNEEAEKQYSS